MTVDHGFFVDPPVWYWRTLVWGSAVIQFIIVGLLAFHMVDGSWLMLESAFMLTINSVNMMSSWYELRAKQRRIWHAAMREVIELFANSMFERVFSDAMFPKLLKRFPVVPLYQPLRASALILDAEPPPPAPSFPLPIHPPVLRLGRMPYINIDPELREPYADEENTDDETA